MPPFDWFGEYNPIKSIYDGIYWNLVLSKRRNLSDSMMMKKRFPSSNVLY
jgi:hypothetical protein